MNTPVSTQHERKKNSIREGSSEIALSRHLLDCVCIDVTHATNHVFSSVTVDLSDVHGAVKNLTDHQASPASDFLGERETFILVRVDSKY